MNYKNFLIIISFTLLTLFLGGNLLAANAEEVVSSWCHDFNSDLRYQDKGKEVEALQIALKKEGFDVAKEDGYFGGSTFLAVVGFQEKYKTDILSPLGLKTGTGSVGKNTRAKLNELYGCKKEKPTIKILSPNGGEVWQIGSTQNITWTSNNAPTGAWVVLVSKPDGELIAWDLPPSGSFSWRISEIYTRGNLREFKRKPGNNYRIEARLYTGYSLCLTFCPSNVPRPVFLGSDVSDGFFRIVGQKVSMEEQKKLLDIGNQLASLSQVIAQLTAKIKELKLIGR